MDPPVADGEVKPEKLEEIKDGILQYNCDLFDTEITHKIAQALLPGLASACVDNTTGGLLQTPASVAVEMRREMVEYLTQRSETFVAESVVLEGGTDAEVSNHPFDVISDFVDDFASSKRNLFSRVSGWLLSERREDRIDDFVQEMEINGFWLLQRREAIAETLLKNVDFKTAFHCNVKFNSAEELSRHVTHCVFRTMNCTNEGCNARFIAASVEYHDMICPFKILPCEQKCSERIMRREMDRHCITVCPMKLVNCPFYPVGCQSTIPQYVVEQHCMENIYPHLLFILQVANKEASVEDLKQRVDQLEKASSPGQLAAARDVRSLSFLIKDLEAKLAPLEVSTTKASEDCVGLPHNIEACKESPGKDEEPTESLAKTEGFSAPPTKEQDWLESHTGKEQHMELPLKKEECKRIPTEEEKCPEILSREEDCREESIQTIECTNK